jgi:multiple sugar transport system substrate-binding protein
MAACGEKETEIQTVTYYCSIGAYLSTLTEEINKWNEGAGKEAGVYIQLESNINTYSTDLEALMGAGTHYDLIDAGTGNAHWKTQGWVQDLEAIDNAELKALIDGYKQYLVNGINYQKDGNGKDILFALPLEVVPIKMTINQTVFNELGLEAPKTWADVIACAKAITEGTNGAVKGYGGTNWSAMWRRLHMKAFSSSTEQMWWDPNTETYSFGQYKDIILGLKTMFENGWMVGLDDLAIDPIRAEFAAGKVGMFVAPSYDFGVYTSQFVIGDAFEWEVIDVPTVGDSAVAKGVWMDRVGCSIDAVNYGKADKAKQEAIVKAFCFLNSDELNSAIYAKGGMIPYKAEVIANTKVEVEQPQWALFADIADYCSHPQFPDSVIPLEGDKIHDVMNAIVHGALEWDAAVADLEARYNAAWQAAKADPDINTSLYSYNYSNAK